MVDRVKWGKNKIPGPYGIRGPERQWLSRNGFHPIAGTVRIRPDEEWDGRKWKAIECMLALSRTVAPRISFAAQFPCKDDRTVEEGDLLGIIDCMVGAQGHGKDEFKGVAIPPDAL